MEACPAAWTRRSQSLRPGPGPSLPGQLPLRPVQGTSHIAVTGSWGQAAALRGGPPVLTGPHSRAQPRGSGASPGRGPGSTLHSRRTREPGVLPCRSLGRAPPQCLWEKIGLQTQNKRPPPSYCHALGALSPLLFILEGKPTERRERWGAKRKREGRRKSKREQRREGKPNPARSPARAQARPAEEPKRCRGERG